MALDVALPRDGLDFIEELRRCIADELQRTVADKLVREVRCIGDRVVREVKDAAKLLRDLGPAQVAPRVAEVAAPKLLREVADCSGDSVADLHVERPSTAPERGGRAAGRGRNDARDAGSRSMSNARWPDAEARSHYAAARSMLDTERECSGVCDRTAPNSRPPSAPSSRPSSTTASSRTFSRPASSARVRPLNDADADGFAESTPTTCSSTPKAFLAESLDARLAVPSRPVSAMSRKGPSRPTSATPVPPPRETRVFPPSPSPPPLPPIPQSLPTEQAIAISDQAQLAKRQPGPPRLASVIEKLQKSGALMSPASSGTLETYPPGECRDLHCGGLPSKSVDDLHPGNRSPIASIGSAAGELAAGSLARRWDRVNAPSIVQSRAVSVASASPLISKPRPRWHPASQRSELGSESVVKRFVRSEWFDYIVGFFIISNAAVMGWQVDYKVKNQNSPPPHYHATELSFCFVFSTELGIKWAVFGMRKFLHGKDWKWNTFDLLIVALQLVEEFCMLLRDSSSGVAFLQAASFLSVLRLARIMRLIRILRLVPELKSLVYLIATSTSAFAWTLVLLMVMIFAIAVYITEAVSGHIAEASLAAESPMLVGWGTLWRSCVSLFQAISGGRDWADLTDPIEQDISTLVSLMLFCYVAFATMVMLNLVTGVFVEGASKKIKEDRNSELIRHVRRLFEQGDDDNDQMVTWDEFLYQVETNALDEYFKLIALEKDDAGGLFYLLDKDGSGAITAEEFVLGCLRLKGPARSVDLSTLMLNHEEFTTRWETHASLVETALRHLNKHLGLSNASTGPRAGVITSRSRSPGIRRGARSADALRGSQGASALHEPRPASEPPPANGPSTEKSSYSAGNSFDD